MMFAGHLPKQQFSLTEWQQMPVLDVKTAGSFPEEGFSRSTARNNKPIVLWFKWVDASYETYAVRPVVRVPMRKAA